MFKKDKCLKLASRLGGMLARFFRKFEYGKCRAAQNIVLPDLGAKAFHAKVLGVYGLLMKEQERIFVRLGRRGFQLITDFFCEDLRALRCFLEHLMCVEQNGDGRRVLVISEDILASCAQSQFRELAEIADKVCIDKIFCLGNVNSMFFKYLPYSMWGIRTNFLDEMIVVLSFYVEQDDVVIIKGSRFSKGKLSKVTSGIKNVKAACREHNSRKRSEFLTFSKKKSKQNIEILFLGDTSFGENYRGDIERTSGQGILEKLSYEYCLENMRVILNRSDLVVANLEAPITDLKKSPFSEIKRYVHWTDVEETVDSLVKYNIKFVNLANNHTLDYGRSGFYQTLNLLNDSQISYFGAGLDYEEALSPFIFDFELTKCNIKVAVFGAMEVYQDYLEDYDFYARDSFCGVNPLLLSEIKESIGNIKSEYPGIFVIVFPHWGTNYIWKSIIQSNLAQELVSAGSDLILGHGAHMLQEFELINGSLVAYGLGDFMFNAPGRYRIEKLPPYSLIAKLVVYENLDSLHGELMIQFYPIVTDNLRTAYQTRFVTDGEFEEVLELLQERSISVPKDFFAKRMDEFGYYMQMPLSVAY